MRQSLIALILLALLGGCGNDNKNNPTSSTAAAAHIADITITAAPVLVAAVPSSDPGKQWQISWVLTVREAAGIAATVTSVEVVIDDAIFTFAADAVSAQSTNGSNRVAANGSLQLIQTIAYTFTDGSKLATVVIVANLTDAGGNRIVKSTQIRIV